MNTVPRPARPRSQSLRQAGGSGWRIVAGTLLAATLVAGPAPADQPSDATRSYLLMETAGQGPSLHVTRFLVDPQAERRAAEGRDSALGRSIQDAARPDDPQWFEEWIQANAVETMLFELEFSLLAADTLVLGAGALTALQTVEGLLMGLSAALSFGKAAWHVSQGETLEALSTAALGTVTFAAQYYGTRALQLGSVAAAIVDITLTGFGTEARTQRILATDGPYRRYYHERGRSVNDWKLLLFRELERRTGPEAFTAALNDEIARYVRLAWDDPYLDELIAGAESRVAGITRYAELPAPLRAHIEAGFRVDLMTTLRNEVLPELAHRAWLLSLADLAHTANMDLRPALNAPWEITLEATGLDAPARFSLDLPTGGAWSGTLEPGSPRLLRMTSLAFLRAGGPHRITLEMPDGPQTRPVIWQDRQARVAFGLPQVGQVAGFALTEGPGRCEVTQRLPDGRIERGQTGSPAPGPGRLDLGSAVDGSVVVGRFSDQAGWSTDAQVFRVEGLALHAAAPMADGLVQIEGCDYGFMRGDRLMAGQCRITRLETRRERLGPAPGTIAAAARLPPVQLTELRCVHEAEMNLTDLYLLEPEGWTRFVLDSEEGRILLDALRQGMEQGFSLQ